MNSGGNIPRTVYCICEINMRVERLERVRGNSIALKRR
jgi:hypothetical protein